ncbi:MAG: CpaF family protein [Phycisphaeraceae bacterium]
MNRSLDTAAAATADPAEPGKGVPGHELRRRMHQQLLETMDLTEARRMPVEQLRAECSRRIDQLLNRQQVPLNAREKQRLLQDVLNDIFGLGPLEDLLADPTISDILINSAEQIYVERQGRLERVDTVFRDDQHLLQVIQRIGSSIGRRIDEASPMLDARLADGSRVNAIIPPLALDGPSMSVRRFGAVPIDIERLLQLESMAPEMAEFLRMCVQSRRSILISGGTGSGKTTLLNVLSRWIPEGERVITIEDAAELQLQRKHVVRLETRPPNIEGKGTVTQRDLLRNSLRMRPDRIVIGEVRGAEALDMLQAMNTGHEGSMTTVHANNPRDALRRVENMVSMAGLNYPIGVIRQQLSSAIDLLVHASRLTGGRRKVVSIAEITGMEADTMSLQELFVFRQQSVDAQGHATGRFEATGARPHLISRLEAEGIHLPSEMFQRRVLSTASARKGSPA